MQSLRKPSVAGQKGSRQQQKLSKSSSQIKRPDGGQQQAQQTRRATRVEDKIKKRMSTRYANLDISAPTLTDGGGGVPAVPAIPLSLLANGLRAGAGLDGSAGLGGAASSGTNVSGGVPYGYLGSYGYRAEDEEGVLDGKSLRAAARERDLRALEQDMFDPDAFLKEKMAASTEAELTALKSSLGAYKSDTNVDLQKNVFKNYVEFMMISKEISTLENDMLELKAGLSEWEGMPSLLHIDDTASLADRRRTQRSSVADLRVLYASQMQQLHTLIEGSSKFVPATPGRHIVTEMEGIYNLNPATYKVEQSVKFILLDDAVLVARKRARKAADRPNLVAERCWPLNDILVLDTKDTTAMTNVFKIRNNKETFVYRCELAADKKALLAHFRQIAEELAAKKRKEREGEHERRKTLWMGAGGDRRSYAFDMDATAAEWMNELSLHAGMSSAKEKSDKDAIWIGELTDSLTLAIALREWDKAVALVEEGEAKKGIAPSLGPKLNILQTTLTNSLLNALSDLSNKRSTVIRLTGLLIALDASSSARSTLLAARAALTRKRVRMIRFEGHVQLYISDLAIVVFTGIKHTADWYLASFKENEAISCFVEWAKTQISSYAEMFRKQVFSADVDEDTVRECIATSHSQNKKLLQEFGLDFSFMLDALLIRNPPDAAAVARMPVGFAPQELADKDEERGRGRLGGTLHNGDDDENTSEAQPRSLSQPRSPTVASPVPRLAKAGSQNSLSNQNPLSPATSRLRVPRNLASPAPPPRSRDRPSTPGK